MAKVKNKATSGPQSVITHASRSTVDSNLAILNRRAPASYTTYRTIRRQPTIAMARALSIAPIVAAEWQVESDEGAPPEWAAFVRKQLLPIREPLVQTIMENRVDYGWSPWEKVFDVAKWDGGPERLVIKKLKPLLVDITEILVDPKTGDFAGFEQPEVPGTSQKVNIELPYSLLVSFGVEGTNWYGEALLENIRLEYLKWLDASDGAERYDRKLAGSHWVIYYPAGQSMYNGAMTPNADIAQAILAALESSGSVAIPAGVKAWLDETNAGAVAEGGTGWTIDIKDPSGKQGTFIERMNYLDKLFVRGMITPERAVLEGEYGTKAEAGIHADWALTQRELEHRHVTRIINADLVEQLLELNFGEQARGKVRLKAAPLVDAKLAFFRLLYQALIANPMASTELIENLDLSALGDLVGTPRKRDMIDTPMGQMDLQNQLAESVRRLYEAANGPANQPEIEPDTEE
jgi:hypothetical protein